MHQYQIEIQVTFLDRTTHWVPAFSFGSEVECARFLRERAAAYPLTSYRLRGPRSTFLA